MPITAKLVADLISKSPGADRILTLDLHAGSDPGVLQRARGSSVRGAGTCSRRSALMNIAGISRWSRPMLAASSAPVRSPSVFTPDLVDRGQAPRRRQRGGGQCTSLATSRAGSALILDDIIDTAVEPSYKGPSMLSKKHGAERVFCRPAIHAVLSGPGHRTNRCPPGWNRVLITNTTPLEEKLEQCPTSCKHIFGGVKLLARGDSCESTTNSSVSSLFV